MSTIYPPYDQYKMDHPDDSFNTQAYMAYPPIVPSAVQMPQLPPQGEAVPYIPDIPQARLASPPHAAQSHRLPPRQPQVRPSQGISDSSLRPRMAAPQMHSSIPPALRTDLPNVPGGAKYPPSNDRVPLHTDPPANRRRKSSYRKSSVVAIVFFSILCIISLSMLGYLLIPRLIAQGEYISLSPQGVANGEDSISLGQITNLFSSNTGDEDSSAQQLTEELLAYYEQINPDFIGWLDVPGTQIHYPMVRTDNNEYYLTHTFKNSYSAYGSIYADYRCAEDFTDANTVIYGHNMRNGTMFHDLTQMLNRDYLNQHSTFTITTSDAQVLTYQIFSVHEVHVSTDYRTITLDGSNRVSYFETLRSYSDVSGPSVQFTDTSRIVTFSTCPNDSDDMYRIAVHALLVDSRPLEEPME